MEDDNLRIKWQVNGLVVQGIDKVDMYCQTKEPYFGVGRYSSWPLEAEFDEESKLLTQEANNKWFYYLYGENKDSYALEVSPSFDYIKSYLLLCNAKEINVRVLSIETNRETPIWQGPDLEKRFLGFDYATSTEFFSAIHDDLYNEETHHLLYKYKDRLSAYGLFSNEEDLTMYIKDRERAIMDGYELEPHGDFCAMKVSEIVIDIPSVGRVGE